MAPPIARVCNRVVHLVGVLGIALPAPACGPGLSRPVAPKLPMPEAPPARAGVPPPADEAGFRASLSGEVTNGGLWFADAPCEAQFGHAGTIKTDQFDAFAHCVAALHLRPSGRAHWHDDASVLTDDAGFEIEAIVLDGRLDFIGFAGRAPGMPDLPTITPEALEALRTSGDPGATISVEDAKRLAVPPGPDRPWTEHLRLCLTETGELRTVMPGTTALAGSVTAFSALARGWRFRPFVAAGHAIPVCAIVGFQYPASAAAPPRRLPQPPQLSNAGHVVHLARPTDLELLRLTGTKLVMPDDVDKMRIHNGRLIGSFKLCLDESGRYERGTLLKTTGLARYDAKIARALMDWSYRPYLLDGTAIPVCSIITFIYTQR